MNRTLHALSGAAVGLGVTLSWAAPARCQDSTADAARAGAASAPLFASAVPLQLTIEAPLNAIFKERGADPKEYPGKITVRQGEEPPVTLDLNLETRGKARLSRQICQFPPLRLNFPKTKVGGTVFAGQDHVKLVTHCQDRRPEYQQYVLQEYLVYRMFNLLTDRSFRVRLVHATYRDTDAKRDTVTRYGFLIESEEMLAARVAAGKPLRLPAVPPESVDFKYLALVGVFQYLIGNPDWSAFGRAPDEKQCCHNTVPIGPPQGPVLPVPYDFDVTGIVNPRYADRLFQPQTRNLGINHVRDRVYRGLCVSESYLAGVFASFNRQREAIYALYDGQADLDPRVLQDTRQYLDAFYQTINDPEAAEAQIHARCRG